MDLNSYEQVQVPSELVGDPISFLQDEMMIKERFPKAIIKKIANAGHWIHAENPKDFTAEILDFLLNK